MATSTTASSTNINTARSAGEGNELLDLRDTDASEQESASDDNGGSADDPAPSGYEPAPQGKDGLSEALKAERRRSNNLEKELRGVRQQLTRFSEINPEEYSRLQEAERQKQLLEQQVELRERQMEEASAKKVATVAAERDGALFQQRGAMGTGTPGLAITPAASGGFGEVLNPQAMSASELYRAGFTTSGGRNSRR